MREFLRKPGNLSRVVLGLAILLFVGVLIWGESFDWQQLISSASEPTPTHSDLEPATRFDFTGADPYPYPAGTVAPAATIQTANEPYPAIEAVPTDRPALDLTRTPTPSPESALPDFPRYTGVPINRDLVGVQLLIHGADQQQILNSLLELNVGWVKVQLPWKAYQPEESRLDDNRFAELDSFANLMQANNIQLMLSVAKAPEWARVKPEFDGPPIEAEMFSRFMVLVSQRYAGKVAAYELWNETNLQREWYGEPFSAPKLAELVRVGGEAIRANDPLAAVVSGAPAPTGINDNVNAVDDRVYFQAMVDAGIPAMVDGIGIHPYGWANPTYSTNSSPDLTVPTHNDHPSFFFLDTITDYRAILQEAGYGALPLWPTEFGWATFNDFDASAPAGLEYFDYVSVTQQAQYTADAIAWGQQNQLGPMMIWNLNHASLLGTAFAEAGYSLLDENGEGRPVYYTVRDMLTD